MSTVIQDLRLALRTLRRSPGFAVVAVLILALGIGATTAIYTVLDHVVLRPLPYDEADRLVYIDSHVPSEGPGASWGVTEAGFFFLRDHNRSFEAIGAYGGAEVGHQFTVVDGDGGARVRGAWVSAGLLDALRARPIIGRSIREEEDRFRATGPGLPSVAMLGHGYWQSQYGGDPGVIGTTIELEGGWGLEVIGVLEPGFHLPHGPVDVWVPLGLEPTESPDSFHGFRVIARLLPGVTVEDAGRDLALLTARFPEAFPDVYPVSFMQESGFNTRVTRLQARVLGGIEGVLWILLGSVALLLVIACANVANLFLVRAETKRRDRAIRAALGAGRGSLLRQALSEALVLTAAAGAIGVWLADGAVRILLTLAPEGAPRLAEVGPDGRSVIVGMGIAAAIGIAFGCLTALRGSPSLTTLRDAGLGAAGSSRRHGIRGTMAVAQMALALVLLASAGLMVRSFGELRGVDLGFDARDVLTVNVHPPGMLDPPLTNEAVQHFYRTLGERVAGLPGVEEVGTGPVPVGSDPGCLAMYVEDRPRGPGEPPPCVRQSTVGPGYFRALGIPLQGREPAWADLEAQPEPWSWTGEVVLTRALADRLWPGQDPIGKGIRLREAGPPYARVVGVTGQLRWEGPDQPPTEHVFGQLWGRTNTLVVRTRPGHAGQVATEVRGILHDMDTRIAIGRIAELEDLISASPAMARTSFTMLLLGIGASMGLLLSAIGLFGVLATLVGQRRNEIGIRIALGARTHAVTAMILRHSLKLALAGIALGVLAALATTRLLQAMLFGVSPGDPVILGAVALVLLAVALLASWLPARRAARVDPMVALRAE